MSAGVDDDDDDDANDDEDARVIDDDARWTREDARPRDARDRRAVDIAVIVARAVATRIVARGERWRSNEWAQIPAHSRSRSRDRPSRAAAVGRRDAHKKFASRDVADADPRPRASFARAVPSLSLSLPSRHPRVSRRGGPTRARLARARRGVVAFARRRGRATDDASARTRSRVDGVIHG